MSELNDSDFYARREQQERALAARAAKPAIRDIHLELARGYGELANRAGAGSAPSRDRLVD